MISEIPILNVVAARFRQGHRTFRFPKEPPVLPARFRGQPVLDPAKCPEGCGRCSAVCPTQAIGVREGKPEIDLGRCLFCPECTAACPTGAVRFTPEYRLAARRRSDLIVRDPAMTYPLAKALEETARRLFGRSLKLRQVSAGGCNACEADANVLGTVGWDLGRFGIQFVASPRHADGLLITGPVTNAMAAALEKTYAAVSPPKLVIAVGACAISGGPFANHPEQQNGAGSRVPVDLYVPGCPPHPATLLDGLLRLLGRIH